ncbi:MAG: flagellar hook-length control protein FliK [Bdellovibrionales bacterium]|nr:flagellar hook-length control protein FliK [Bdellovibrionales bacterium]
MNVNIAGLNNLLATKPQTAAKGTSSKDSKGSSFEDVLGQAKSSELPETRATRNEQAPPRETQRAEQQPEPNAEQKGLDSAGLPNTLPPSIGTPVNERVMSGPMLASPPLANKAMLGKAVAGEENVDSLTRRVVWNDFLRKMKDEFGVSAEDVLQAFGSLSDEDLAKPPTETVDKVVMALGLNDQQSVLAKQYFQDLIQKTQSRSIGEELTASSKQINLSLMSEREMQRKAMERSLGQMNSNFFMTGPNARPQVAPNMETPLQANSVKLSSQEIPVADGKTPSLAALTPNLDPMAVPLPSAPSPAPVAQAAPLKAAMAPQQPNLDQLTAQMQPVTPQDKSVDQLLQKFMQGQSPLPEAKGMRAAVSQAVAASTAMTANAAAAPTPALSASTMNGLLAALDKGISGDGDGEEESGSDFTDASFLNMPIHDANSKLNAPIGSGNDFQAQLGLVKPEATMAPADLVEQAQVMVRDGGGEMKVTLNQEGLGEVAMKVSVDQGKVNVQMITESDEAKKLIERQLNELKTSLTHNHLQVTDIKVDTATNMGKQMEQQYQDAQRQMAQASWEQFRQDNQGWRRSFFDTASARQYKGQSEAPRDVQAPTSAASRRAAGSRRLDLVA